jgi:tetratricopeptide (TPR) repeat protein
MKRMMNRWALAGLAAGALFFAGAPEAGAQNSGSISGVILDLNAKPWAGLNVRCMSDQGAKQDVKTGNDGRYLCNSLRAGIYDVTITQFPPPNDKQPPYQIGKVQVQTGASVTVDANFKDILAKQGAAAQEQVKKQEEERKKFEGMKAAFTAGTALLDQEKAAKAELQKATPDQRDALKQKVTDLSDQAAAKFQEAKAGTTEKDPNRALILANLGAAYDLANRNEEAAKAYQEAIDVAQSNPKVTGAQLAGYYNNLGNALAHSNKIDEAKAAYTKSAEADPANAATAWRNFGISLYNANRLGDAVEPLQKSVELDPNSAQTWYLLGASLVYKMTTKKNGDKEEIVLAPGTVEAYKKAIELDPNGPFGAQAKQGLEQLQQMGASGIDTRVNVKKKKS